MEKMWAVMVYLSHNMWRRKDEKIVFDDEVWDTILKTSKEAGINTILLDVGDGVVYDSHPELAIEGSWTRARVHAELEKARSMGITIIPKLNFSATHDFWLGEYERMVSTGIYYKVCRDLIHEVYDIFEKPKYIHLGMDEETIEHFGKSEITICRHGELLWHDLKYLCDCARETGATPWIWADPFMDDPEGFKQRFKPDEVLLSPWYYQAIKEEHFKEIATDPICVEYYSKGIYENSKLKYVEDDIFHTKFRREALPATQHGYRFVPTVSTWNRCEYNTPEVVEYFKNGAPDTSMVGYMTAPWVWTIKDKENIMFDSIERLKKAKEEFYPAEDK